MSAQPMASPYDVLFEPVQIGPLVTRNRFFQVPHCNGMGYRDPSAHAAMRRAKAEGGWGVVCTEEVEIHPTSDLTPYIELRACMDVLVAMNNGPEGRYSPCNGYKCTPDGRCAIGVIECPGQPLDRGGRRPQRRPETVRTPQPRKAPTRGGE